MTSSLVGSEMCIRDSPNTPTSGTQPAWRARRASQQLRHLRTPACHYVPVSYTHLTLPTICSV
eukprot:12052605-Prorocentrum_lima.AAC.1